MGIDLTSIEKGIQGSDELRSQVATLLRDTTLSQEKAAKEAGISPATLNQWLQGKYRGANEAVEDKLTIWIASRQRRTATAQTLLATADYAPTPSGERIKTVLTYAQMAADP